jgi:hypothetical protein
MKEEMVVGLSAPGPVGRWGAAPPQAMLERMKDYGQEGAFALWDDLSPEDRELLVRDIEVRLQCALVPAVPGPKIWFLVGIPREGLFLRWNYQCGCCSDSCCCCVTLLPSSTPRRRFLLFVFYPAIKDYYGVRILCNVLILRWSSCI